MSYMLSYYDVGTPWPDGFLEQIRMVCCNFENVLTPGYDVNSLRDSVARTVEARQHSEELGLHVYVGAVFTPPHGRSKFFRIVDERERPGIEIIVDV